ncbi:MAG: heat-inducible transcriptional repressor HrcA [Candidatus Carbobacillus sp.]|nr:heat-inducible transcriptional repressor HrcA [Candidatus Carbobacillus sp.]
MLTERQRAILRAVVENYIRYAEPIGSRTIAKTSGMNYSAATIRNEMADLEEMGYLEQPHTSAGRIPSEKGYRYYVDHLMSIEETSEKFLEDLRSRFHRRFVELDDALRHAAALLSDLSHYTVVALGPEIVEARLKKLDFIPLDEERVVAILVTDAGRVEHRTLNLPEGLTYESLRELTGRLNRKLSGTTIAALGQAIYQELARVMEEHRRAYVELTQFVQSMVMPKVEEKLIIDGKLQILSQPEFQDVEKMRALLHLFEEPELLSHVLRQAGRGITVKIGAEHELSERTPLSLVTGQYDLGQEQMTIAIIGPTRMDYARAMGLMHAVFVLFESLRET